MNKSQTAKSVDALDRALNTIAKQSMRDGETFEQAYARMSYEDVGFRALINRQTQAHGDHARSLDPTVRTQHTNKRAVVETLRGTEAKLDELAKRRQETTGEGYAGAYNAVLETDEGRDLYRDHDWALRSAQTQ